MLRKKGTPSAPLHYSTNKGQDPTAPLFNAYIFHKDNKVGLIVDGMST